MHKRDVYTLILGAKDPRVSTSIHSLQVALLSVNDRVLQGDDFQFIRYIGHTVQGGYKGAFVVARGQTLSPESIDKVKAIAKEQGVAKSLDC
jgi:hypothetical protein